jgi:hypothetical protein
MRYGSSTNNSMGINLHQLIYQVTYRRMTCHIMSFDMMKIRRLFESRNLPIQMLQPSIELRIAIVSVRIQEGYLCRIVPRFVLKCCTYTGSNRTIVTYKRISASVSSLPRRYFPDDLVRISSRRSRDLKSGNTLFSYAF